MADNILLILPLIELLINLGKSMVLTSYESYRINKLVYHSK